MTQVNEFIYKRITQEGVEESGKVPENGRAMITYNAYWEGEIAPFDSSFMRGDSLTFFCGRGQVLPGLEEAVKTMYKGEEAQFVISYHLLFRDMGCPPRVKPKADGLFIIKLLDFADVGDEDAINKVPEEDRNKFSVILDRVKEVHLKGIDYFKHGNLNSAVRAFHKAVTALQFCRLSDEQEQQEQQKFLIKLFINLAVCYNRLNYPQKACSMCNELRRLTNINENCKALFQEGRALLMIGDFQRARNRLQRAQQLEPNNAEVIKELKLLNSKYETYKNNERNIWQKAMGLVEESKESDKANGAHLNVFKKEIGKYLKDFRDNDNNRDLTLPDGLSADEVRCVNSLAEELDLKMTISDLGGQRTYVIARNKKV